MLLYKVMLCHHHCYGKCGEDYYINHGEIANGVAPVEINVNWIHHIELLVMVQNKYRAKRM